MLAHTAGPQLSPLPSFERPGASTSRLPGPDDLDDPCQSHNSLSARSMSSLATTVDSVEIANGHGLKDEADAGADSPTSFAKSLASRPISILTYTGLKVAADSTTADDTAPPALDPDPLEANGHASHDPSDTTDTDANGFMSVSVAPKTTSTSSSDYNNRASMSAHSISSKSSIATATIPPKGPDPTPQHITLRANSSPEGLTDDKTPNGTPNGSFSKPFKQPAANTSRWSSSSTSSMPTVGQRSVSSSVVPRMSMSASSPIAPTISARSNSQVLLPTSPAVAPNRNSVSSQRSATSSTTGDRRFSLSAYGHRSSFSFSRRRNTAAGPSVPNAQVEESTMQEIDRLRNAIIAQRESKRRRREFLEDERVLVGTKVSEGHVNFVTAYNMLTGLRVSVSRCNAKVNRELCDADFTACNKLAFDISGNELTPSAKYDFKFKDYAPWVFRHLRDLFKLDPADYLMSLTSKYIVSELGSPGKSGSFFYFSRDYRFIIKTIHHSEHKMLRKILKDYYNHVKSHPNTLMSQFYGLHRVKLPFGRKIHFIVMNNLFPPHRDIHRTYDLKGSTLGRRLVEGVDYPIKRSPVYKDLNWIDDNQHLYLGPKKRRQFLEQLEIDVQLLRRLNIMDYSLLVGIHDLTKGNTENIRDRTLQVFEPEAPGMPKSKLAELRRALASASPQALAELDLYEYERDDFVFYADSGGFQSTDDHDRPLTDIYYLGVIDCLTPYTFAKRVETFFKSLSNARPSISAVPATEYGDRFVQFIKDVVVSTRSGNLANGLGRPETQQAEAGPGPSTQAVVGDVPSDMDAQHLPALSEASTEVHAEAL